MDYRGSCKILKKGVKYHSEFISESQEINEVLDSETTLYQIQRMVQGYK